MKSKSGVRRGNAVLAALIMIAFFASAVFFVMTMGVNANKSRSEQAIKEKAEKDCQAKFEKEQEDWDKKIEAIADENRIKESKELARKYKSGEKIVCDNSESQIKENDVSRKNGYLLKTEEVNGKLDSVRFEGKNIYFEWHQCT